MKRIVADLKCEMKEQRAIKAGVHAILRDQLIKSYNYFMQKGYLEIHDRDNINNLYLQYHALGANGVIDNLVGEMMRLPVKRRKENVN